MEKKFNFSCGTTILPLIQDSRGCVASDRVTVDGRKVGYMYREETSRSEDSGWVFLAGDESQEYMDDVHNHSVFSLNTIVNHDPEILPCLSAPVGSSFARDEQTGEFFEIEE